MLNCDCGHALFNRLTLTFDITEYMEKHPFALMITADANSARLGQREGVERREDVAS
jgi:hypothetical protein